MTLFLAPEKVKSGYFNFHHPAVMIFIDSIEMCSILFGKGKKMKKKGLPYIFFRYLLLKFSHDLSSLFGDACIAQNSNFFAHYNLMT